jgi:predicted nucleic acid-binding protein
MYLADTNIVSELMRPRPDPGVGQWMLRLEGGGFRVVVSAMTVDEIVFGLERKPHPAKSVWFDRFLVNSTVLPVTDAIARRAGGLRAQLAAQGRVREQADMLIAATAQVHALTLVTRNVRDFDGCGIALLNPFDA